MPQSPPKQGPTVANIASLAGIDWLADARLQRLMTAVAGSDEEIRVVGGAVRNALMGHPVADIDLATTATPQIVMERAKQRGMKPVPTGIDHGTVTVVVDGHPFEVTTLRQDVATDGRHATVAFGRDWAIDARRRDFTVNALYRDTNWRDHRPRRRRSRLCRASHPLHRRSCRAHPGRTISGSCAFFRFHATFSDGPIDPAGLAAAVATRDGLLTLSAERTGQETLKLIVAAHAPDVLRLMHDTGILSLALGIGAIDLDQFACLSDIISGLDRKGLREDIRQPAALLTRGAGRRSDGGRRTACQKSQALQCDPRSHGYSLDLGCLDRTGYQRTRGTRVDFSQPRRSLL